MSSLEALAQNIIGQFLAFLVLAAWQVPMLHSFGIMASMFFVSLIRSYCVRRFFTHLDNKEIVRGR